MVIGSLYTKRLSDVLAIALFFFPMFLLKKIISGISCHKAAFFFSHANTPS